MIECSEMIHSITSTRIARPMAEVFAFLQVVDNYPLWQVDNAPVSASNGLNKGSRITSVRKSKPGAGLTTTIEITQNNGRDHIESVTVSGKYRLKTSYKLSPEGEATKFVIEIDGQALSLPKEAETALQYLAESQTQEDLARLKLVLEKDNVPTA